jgi:hypothetical protein
MLAVAVWHQLHCSHGGGTVKAEGTQRCACLAGGTLLQAQHQSGIQIVALSVP